MVEKNNNNELYVCDQNTSNNKFSKLIRYDLVNTKITIPPKTQKYKKFTISIPKTVTGDIIGCLSYTIDGGYSKNT